MPEKLQRITYVEDEPDIRAVAEIALVTVGGFTLDVCSRGQEALDKAPGFAPQLILLDVMMPGLDGVATFGKLKETPELVDTPVIFMTAKAQKHEIESYKSLGAIGVIPKPFDPMTLSQQIVELWEARQVA